MIDYIKKYPLLLLLIIVAFVSYMLTIMPSGSEYCFGNSCGLFFWGAHGHDAIWHLAIVAASFTDLPFVAPTFPGAQLSGYNFFLDIVIFVFSKLGIPALITYFKVLPLVWFTLFTALIIKLGRKLHDSSLFVGLLLFFMYFSGSFSYFITLLKDKTIEGSGALLAMQSLLTLTNVQFGFSLCVLLYILIKIKENKSDTRSIFLLSILTALNIALKFYGGVISLFIVGIYFLLQSGKERRLGSFLTRFGLLGAFAALSVLLFYNPFAPTTGGAIMTFKPLATVYPLIEDPNLLYMPDKVNAKYFLENSGKFSPRLVLIQFQVIALFLLLNFGTRILGLLYILKLLVKRQFSTFHFLITLTIIFAMFLNIFFVQKGQWWNTVQFSYYAFFLANIFTASALYELVKRFKRGGVIITLFIILLTIPSSIDIFKTFAQFPAHSYIPEQELAALSFLKTQPPGVIFTPLPNKEISRLATQVPIPLSHMNDSAYIAAFSGKQQYIADEVQLQLTGVDYQERFKKSLDWNCEVLKEVDYLYELTSRPITNLTGCQGSIEQIFQNKTVTVYRVNPK
ncbi:MAG: hypothetical protein WBO77_01845 [Microgenomates group bacterium]